jgi:hypothetical protein
LAAELEARPIVLFVRIIVLGEVNIVEEQTVEAAMVQIGT